MKQLRNYIEALGLNLHVSTFDGGQTWTVTRAGDSLFRIRMSYDWGDEDFFDHAMRRALPSLPEEDPSVQHEGVYL